MILSLLDYQIAGRSAMPSPTITRTSLFPAIAIFIEHSDLQTFLSATNEFLRIGKLGVLNDGIFPALINV